MVEGLRLQVSGWGLGLLFLGLGAALNGPCSKLWSQEDSRTKAHSTLRLLFGSSLALRRNYILVCWKPKGMSNCVGLIVGPAIDSRGAKRKKQR